MVSGGRIDHLVYTVPDLEAETRRLAGLTGVTAAAGGSHPGFGTRNALLDLTGGMTLELMGPDPGSPAPEGGRPLGLDELAESRLSAWALRVTDIEDRVARARRQGYDPGDPVAMSRTRPDGTEVRWRMTLPRTREFPILVPALIDWGGTAHPSMYATPGLRLVSLRGRHPDLEGVRRKLAAIGCDLDLAEGPRPELVATIATPNGELTLR